jgi:hypothetical protein
VELVLDGVLARTGEASAAAAVTGENLETNTGVSTEAVGANDEMPATCMFFPPFIRIGLPHFLLRRMRPRL